MVRVWLAAGIASAVLFGPYFCAWANLWENEYIGQWYVSSEIDPIFDTKNIFARLSDFRDTKLGPDPRSGYLNFRCQEEELSAYISWGEFLGDLEEKDQAVIFRFDTLEPQEEVWRLSKNDRSTFVPNAMKFMLQATMHERLAARTDGSDIQLTLIFNLEDVREVVSRVFGACNLSENIPYEDVYDE